jgi:hypothetical protein
MSRTDVTAPARTGFNLAKDLDTNEPRHSAVRNGHGAATIDHTGYILTENLNGDDSWQFLFNNRNGNSRFHGGHEISSVYSCPASPDRWYVFTARVADDPTGAIGHLAQIDFTRSNGLVNAPSFKFLSQNSTFVFPFVPGPSFPEPVADVQYFPEDQVYLRHVPGPFAIRLIGNERFTLFGTDKQPEEGFTIQSLRLARNGTTLIAEPRRRRIPKSLFRRLLL